MFRFSLSEFVYRRVKSGTISVDLLKVLLEALGGRRMKFVAKNRPEL